MTEKKIAAKLFDLSGKVIILTGSAGRLGTRFAHVLSDAGANVVLVDMEQKNNKKLERELTNKYKTKPLTITADITKEFEVRKIKQIVLSKYKKIDILINNAHYVPRDHPDVDAPFEQYPVELWEKTTSDNLKAIFLCSREIGKVMSKQQSGVIVNISSIYGIVGTDQRIYGKSKLNSPASYAATKGGVVNLTRYLAAYWHRKNIRVNTLTLGGVYDEGLHSHNKEFVKNYSQKTMIGRMANKEDYDGALLYLVSDASSYMTGANLIVDGGWSAW
jgi:NAD(P)-dependent dehydrogenase (short-subunit alcohol dehydrogenase family)